MKLFYLYKLKLFRLLFLCLVSFCFAAMLFLNPSGAIKGANNGLLCCANIIIPSLFPFLVLTEFVVKSGLAASLGKIAARPIKFIFALPGCTAAPIFMSFIGGYPVGARAAAELVRRGEITHGQANRMLCFCVNAGPAFILSAVGISMLGSLKAGALLLASHVLASLIIGVLLSVNAPERKRGHAPLPQSKESLTLSEAFVKSTADASFAMFSICSFVVFFFTLIALLSDLDAIYITLAKLGTEPQLARAVISLLLEVTAGCTSIAEAGIFTIPMLSFALSWAGLCVHCQILSCASNVQISVPKFIAFRLLNAVLSATISIVLLKLFPISTPVFSSGSGYTPKLYSYSPAASIALLLLCIAMLLSCKRKDKGSFKN